MRFIHPDYFRDDHVICVTANRFDFHGEYDAILCVGEINSRRFDPLQCSSVRNIDVLLYDCEEKVFSYRRKKQKKLVRNLNRRIGFTESSSEPEDSDTPEEKSLASDLRQFSALDEYIDSFGAFDIRKIAHTYTTDGGHVPVAEVKFVGSFVTGEQILFSKYYAAAVFDAASESVTEKSPEQLRPGDVLVFVKRDDYTKNIVDFIYERLLHDRTLDWRISYSK